MTDVPPTAPGLAAPPTGPCLLEPEGQRPAWPKVIGVIAIVYGSLFVVGGMCGLLQLLYADAFTNWYRSMLGGIAGEQYAAALETTLEYKPWFLLMNLAAFFLAVLLVVAGADLCYRRPRAVPRIRFWAVATLVLLTVQSVVTYFMFFAQMEAYGSRRATAGYGVTVAPNGAMALFSAVFGWVFWAVFPVFLLIWLSRGWVVHQVATWANPTQPATPDPRELGDS